MYIFSGPNRIVRKDISVFKTTKHHIKRKVIAVLEKNQAQNFIKKITCSVNECVKTPSSFTCNSATDLLFSNQLNAILSTYLT